MMLLFVLSGSASAAIINAEDALGQLDVNNNPKFDTKLEYNGELTPNSKGLSYPSGLAIDYKRHKLFVSQNRGVHVYNMDDSNQLVDRVADFIIGQPNFNSENCTYSQRDMCDVYGMSIDEERDYLFVTCDNRVLVFDISNIYTYMPASYVIGQADFDSYDYNLGPNRFADPMNVIYDHSHKRLFVFDTYNYRILIFDATTLSNNMSASYVLGQPDFYTADYAFWGAINKLGAVFAGDYDPVSNTLIVGFSDWSRVVFFDMNNPQNNMRPYHTIGADDIDSDDDYPSPAQDSLYYPNCVLVDKTQRLLYVYDSYNTRIMVFDLNDLKLRQKAVGIIGHNDYVTDTVYPVGPSSFYGNYDQGMLLDKTNGNLYVTDEFNHRVLTFKIVSINSKSFDNGTVGESYSSSLNSTNIKGTATYSLESGTLPGGLSLSTAGVISGTPTTSGTYNFSIKVNDYIDATANFSDSKSYTIVIKSPPPVSAPISTPAPTPIPSAEVVIAPNQNAPIQQSAQEPLQVLNDNPSFATDLGVNVDLAPDEIVNFYLPTLQNDISNNSGEANIPGQEQHSITINAVGSNFADITIASEPISLRLYIGETKEVDVNKDAQNDISVYLSSITSGKANFVIKQLALVTSQNKEAPAVKSAVESQSIPATSNSKTIKSVWVYAALYLLFVILLLSVIFTLKRKNKIARF